MAMKPVERECLQPSLCSFHLILVRIIQDCEDALTNWVPQHAAVSSKLSVRSRNLSQRRGKQREAVDLSGQDAPMDRESWRESYDGEEDEHHEETENGSVNGERRGRETEREVAA